MLNPEPVKTRALSNAFLKASRNLLSDVVFFKQPGPGCRLSGPEPTLANNLVRGQDCQFTLPRSRRARARLKDAREVSVLTHRLNEFRTGYSLIGLLASIARLRFTGHHQIKTVALANGTIYHRTVANLLIVCLSLGDNPIPK